MKNYSDYSVLVVDDVPLNLMLVEKMLTRFNFVVKKAGSGVEALEMIEAERPSVVLLDLLMPNMDGYEVLRRIRANAATKDLPVIILTALNSDADIIKGFKTGANDFITKPIIMDRLIRGIERQLGLVEE